MKTLLLALTTAALVLGGTMPTAEARHRSHRSTYIVNYTRCGCPVFATRYVAYRDYWGRPVWRTRYHTDHRCHRNYYGPRYYDGYHRSNSYNPYDYRSPYYRPGITIRF